MRAIALAVPSLLAAVQYLVYKSALPERIATHFGSDGQANGWMSRSGFFGFYAGLLAFILVLMVLAVPAAIGRLPASMINLPNRDYWLAPERVGETKRKLTSLMAIFGLGVGLFIVCVMQLVLQTNQGGKGTLSSSSLLALTVGFLLFIVGFIVVLVRGFRQP